MAREKRLEYPNRRKATSRITKWITVLLLLVSAGLVTVITVGGWEALQGAKLLQLVYIVLFVLCAFLIARWRSGILPVAAALAMVLLIFAAIAGPEWFDRDKSGFVETALAPDLLGLVTLLLVPLQVLVMAFAMSGLRQRWTVEVEGDDHDEDAYDDRGGRAGAVALPA